MMEKTVNSDLDSLFNWLCKNGLSVNASKSKFCLFGKKHSLKSVHFQSLNIVINNQKIIHENEIKYLGVIFDQSLTFYAHADYITRSQLSTSTKLLLYSSIALPHLEFCSTLLYSLPAFKIDQIQIVQNRAMRCILKCNRYIPVATMLNVLNMLCIKQMIVFATHVFVFKIKHKLLPPYICR